MVRTQPMPPCPVCVLQERVKTATHIVTLVRQTTFVGCEVLGVIERSQSPGEKRAYEASLELLANFVAGEIDGTGPSNDELPGPDMATLPPKQPAGPESAAPGNAPVATGFNVVEMTGQQFMSLLTGNSGPHSLAPRPLAPPKEGSD